jgi:hypothetical protein
LTFGIHAFNEPMNQRAFSVLLLKSLGTMMVFIGVAIAISARRALGWESALAIQAGQDIDFWLPTWVPHWLAIAGAMLYASCHLWQKPAWRLLPWFATGPALLATVAAGCATYNSLGSGYDWLTYPLRHGPFGYEPTDLPIMILNAISRGLPMLLLLVTLTWLAWVVRGQVVQDSNRRAQSRMPN